RCQDREARARHHPRVEGAAPRTTLLSRGIFTFAMRRGSRAPASGLKNHEVDRGDRQLMADPPAIPRQKEEKSNPRAWEGAVGPASLRYNQDICPGRPLVGNPPTFFR
ncbi:MAG: hypothetical protein O9972_11875, partial [Burkholderiales bacterium]|nr:hypothetical protein [Burkholderiales bacterium]